MSKEKQFKQTFNHNKIHEIKTSISYTLKNESNQLKSIFKMSLNPEIITSKRYPKHLKLIGGNHSQKNIKLVHNHHSTSKIEVLENPQSIILKP